MNHETLTYPLESIGLEEAMEKQFRLVDTITRHIDGESILSMGDLGILPGLGKPATAAKVEAILAEYFGCESCVLLRGAGTGALRFGILSIFGCGDTILVHDAPIYPTTEVNITSMGLQLVRADFNDAAAVKAAMEQNPDIKGALVQYTRQRMEDRYDMGEVISAIKSVRDIPVLTDDNYAVMKVSRIGVELGADLSAFSAFKLLGPEGVGILVGKRALVEKVDKLNYSGGSKVQGHEAMELLRGLIYAPVALAVQAQQNEKLLATINTGKLPGIKRAFLANAQSKVLLVELDENISKEVLEHAKKLGAAPNPVGAESKYEFVPMFYRVSGTFLKADPTLGERMIRINPMRAGAATVLRILTESIRLAKEC
ncbi:MAG: aminotransferase class V-fold PLP-dependent enzyme [Angelakisella sp.]